MQKKKKTAFSLVELSIVILIVSILVTGSLGISKTAIGNSKAKITKERMDTIYKALTSFVATNRRLPCPALLTVAKGTSTYGNETGTGTGTCTGLTPNVNTVYGMIPIKALGLEPNMGEDGFGTKFSYVVDQRFTKQSASTASVDGFEIVKAVKAEDGVAISPTLIRVQGPSGTDILPDLNALFVLISHGANKNSGWNATGTAQNPAGAIADETSNSAASFDSTFIAYSTDANFDDILLFKNKPQLVRDVGLEFMMCNAAEAKTSTYNWTTNGNYGCSVCSNTPNFLKKCGKYGVWSAVSSDSSCTANSSACTAQSATFGQVLNKIVVPFTGSNIIIGSTSFITIATANYTPVSSSSKIIIEFHAPYSMGGSGADSFESTLTAQVGIISYQQQQYYNSGGSGSRSGSLFPIMGTYNNTSTATKTFTALARRVAANDNITVYRNTGSMNMIITEVAN